MSVSPRLPSSLVFGLLATLATGCAVTTSGGYGEFPGAGNFDFGANYYEQSGAFFGGWGRGYDVAPYGYNRPFYGQNYRYNRPFYGRNFEHAWRTSPGARVIPTIPGGQRGGQRGGGFHGGGGHSR